MLPLIYIYDILVNFNDIEKIYDFFEWNTNDEIEHIKRIPLYKIPPKVLDQFFMNQIQLDHDIMEKIYRTTEIFTRSKVTKLDYACLFSDGTRVLAIEFNEKGESIFKSKLLLDEEEDVANLSVKLEFTEPSYKILREVSGRNFLTRKEENVKKYLLKEIISTYQEEDYKKLKFLYEEYTNGEEADYKKMYQHLLESMSNFLDEKHLHLYEVLKLSHKKKQV